MELTRTSLLLWTTMLNLIVLCTGISDERCGIFQDYLEDPTDCHYYIQCFSGRGYRRKCPFQFAFNPTKKSCDWPEYAKSCPHSAVSPEHLDKGDDSHDINKRVVVCYVEELRMRGDPGVHRLKVDNIDPSLCTHLVSAFASIDTERKDIRPQYISEKYHRLSHLKVDNPKLKILLAVEETPDVYSALEQITQNQTTLERFVNNVVRSVRDREFDGLDFPWYRPDGQTLTHFLSLCRSLHQAMVREANDTHMNQLFLTTHVNVLSNRGLGVVNQTTWQQIVHEAGEVQRYLDWITVKGFHDDDVSYQRLSHNSPLYTSRAGKQPDPWLDISQNEALHIWEKMGVPYNKLVLGISMQGHSFKMTSLAQRSIGDDARGPGKPGPYLKKAGILSFPAICLMLKRKTMTRVWLGNYSVPAAYGYRGADPEWIAYEDAQSIKVKADFIVQEGLRGAMFWSLEYDDHENLCGQGTFPLVGVLKETLFPPEKEMEIDEMDARKESGGKHSVTQDLWVILTTLTTLLQTAGISKF